MIAVQALFYTFLGAALGSFLNVCIDRLPAGRSIVSPPSECQACSRRLTLLDMIPVASYLALRGRCRTCRTPIPARVLAVEALTAIVFALAWLRYGASLQTLFTSLYAAILITVAFIDLEHHLIPNRISYPAIGLAFLTALVTPNRSSLDLWIGGVVGFGVLLLITLFHQKGMGMGDVKLAAFIGLAVGFPEIVLTLLMAFVVGGVVALALLASRVLRRRDPIAFGPFLALAAIVIMLYGGPLTAWWLGGF